MTYWEREGCGGQIRSVPGGRDFQGRLKGTLCWEGLQPRDEIHK